MTQAADPRNALQGARRRPLQGLVAGAGLVGGGLLTFSLLHLDLMNTRLEPAFWLICGLLLLTEARPLFTGATSDTNGLTVSTAFVFAVLLRYGLPAALSLQALSTLVAEVSKHRAWWRTWFNVSQYLVSWAAAGAVMALAGVHAQLAQPLDLMGTDLPAVALGALAYFIANELLVGLAISLQSGDSLYGVLRADLGYEVLTTAALLALSPLVCLAAERGPAFVPLLLPPLLAVYAVASVARDREHRALTDALTGLANRVLLKQRTDEALHEGPVALVLFDLDRFKEVNDTLGHHVGDRLLQVVAERLTLAVRACDTVARLGGDEFALVLPLPQDAASAVETAERLRAALSEPIILEGLLLDVGASAGVAVSPEHGTDVEVLLQHADVAMYLAKESGSVELYDAGRDRHTPSRLSMLGELRRALETDELELHYQPEVALADGVVVGVEALVRWRHPVRGLVPPDDFVPLAERSGLVHALTAWVVDAALRQVAVWQEQGLPMRLAVNVTVKDLCGDGLALEVERALRRHGVPAEQLRLEVTEGSLLADPVRAAGTLRRLAELGVTLSLDDFGTGYSSLAHLRRLPVREIKVDRSFVHTMDDSRDYAVVRSVVDLGHGLGMTVVAEGVEDARTFHRLAEMGCDVAQGWFISKALPADELTPWLVARLAAATTAG